MPSCRSVLVLALVLTGVLAAPAGAAQVASSTVTRSGSRRSTARRSGRVGPVARREAVARGRPGRRRVDPRRPPRGRQAGHAQLDGAVGAGRGLARHRHAHRPERAQLYAYPTTLDLTLDGGGVVYGYANSSGFGLDTDYEFGTYAEGSTNWFLDPYDATQIESGTLAGRRLVGVSGTSIILQDATGVPPNTNDFTPWFDAGGIGGDVGTRTSPRRARSSRSRPATSGSQDRDVPVRIARRPDDDRRQRLLAARSGRRAGPSISQDGTMMAVEDDRGVVVAGTPVCSRRWRSRPATSRARRWSSRRPGRCRRSGRRPPRRRRRPRATGRPAPAGRRGPAAGRRRSPPTGGPPPHGDARPHPARRGPPQGRADHDHRRGPGAGHGRGTVGGKVVAKASGRALRAGKLKLRLKATKAGRKRLKKLRGKSLVSR